MRDRSRPAGAPGGVLILTAATGGGHDSVAAALREALHGLAPAVGVRVLDPLAGPLSPGRWYDATVAHAPWLWGLFYRATDNGLAVRLGAAAGALLWARRLRAVIETERPALVVAVHPLCARLAAGVLRATPGAPSLHCVVTDLVTFHRCWACDGVAAFYVATPEARDALAALGVPRGRVRVTGLPVRAAFGRAARPPAGDAPPRVLLLGGGCPSRQVERVARALAASPRPPRLVVVCGRNARLRRRLARALGPRATVLGWRDDIAALMRWSTLVVARGGPTTLAEALSQARPVVIYQALPGQEAGNVALAEQTGVGRYIPDVAALARAVATPADSPPAADPAQAAWWAGAARRVVACLLAARAPAPPAPAVPRFAPARPEEALTSR
ncbi:MAG TPA: glycosyltransferase [Thermomicrobiales bacterium]|nr:glycosyltransferase [Thermomicrobiales bacterium]